MEKVNLLFTLDDGETQRKLGVPFEGDWESRDAHDAFMAGLRRDYPGIRRASYFRLGPCDEVQAKLRAAEAELRVYRDRLSGLEDSKTPDEDVGSAGGARAWAQDVKWEAQSAAYVAGGRR